jgi:hypothetical protein
MDIEILLTPHTWLQASTLTRKHLADQFGLKRSTSPRCVTERGFTRIESDGHTVDDLRAMNVESMQEYLGFTSIDPNANVHALFKMCVEKIEALHKPEAVEEQVVAPAPLPPEEPKAPFCDACGSKGVRHKKDCAKLTPTL